MATFAGVKGRDGTVTRPTAPVVEHHQADEAPAEPPVFTPLRDHLDSITPATPEPSGDPPSSASSSTDLQEPAGPGPSTQSGPGES